MAKRCLQSVLLAFVTLTMLGAASPTSRFDKLGHKLMCTCGCAEILLECNHVGCPDSPGLIAALHTQIDSGASDSSIFKTFADTYGPTVLAAPLRGGFDNVAWIVPFAILVLGLAGVAFLLRTWRRRHALHTFSTPTPADATNDALRDRIRNETNYGE